MFYKNDLTGEGLVLLRTKGPPEEIRTGSRVASTYPTERLTQQLSFTEITPAELQRITSYAEIFRSRIPQMVDAFYDHLWSEPQLRMLVDRFSTVARLKQTLAEYLDWLVRGKLDIEYANHRYGVGTVHERIGLAPQWYLGMFHIFETHIVAMIQEHTPERVAQREAIIAFMKLLNLDMQLALEAYIQAYLSARTDLERLQSLNEALSKSSQDLASTAEEFSAGSEEMNASVAAVSSESGQVAAQTRQAMERAEAGAVRIQQVATTIRQVAGQMAAMQAKVDALFDSSRQMESILKAVEAVAKQTNLLSLNAAIEAARAGQHGRGFAVVADEVRRLSDRTQSSLRDISSLINASQTQVEAVSQTASEVGSAASGASDAVSEAEQEFAEISRLVADSTTRAESINRSLKELSAMSDHVKEGAEHQATLAATLAELAKKHG